MAQPDSNKVTLASSTPTRFGRPDDGLTLVGVLTPSDDSPFRSQVRIEHSDLSLGRGSTDDGIDVQLADANVSRRHARIWRFGNQFVLEDLGSSNGTYVDGVPVHWALLHDGDRIQIGRNLFFFDHVYEFGQTAASQWPPESATRHPIAGEQVGVPEDEMTVRFWGTRGSLPTPGAATSKFGGNTTCVEVRFRDTIIVLDAGSGIREMSRSWKDEFDADPIEASLLLSHLHWDHIQGFPFFAAAYQPDNQIDVYGATRNEGTTEQLLGGQMQGAYFPIPISAMKADLRFHDRDEPFSIGDVRIEPFALPHPGGSRGYRLTAGGAVFVYATDCELDQVATNREELRRDPKLPREYQDEFLKPFESADLLLIDGQYTDLEYAGRVGWGHNSLSTVVDFCRQVRPKKLALTHHDPMSTDAIVNERVHWVSEALAEHGDEQTLVFGAREQLCLSAAFQRSAPPPSGIGPPV